MGVIQQGEGLEMGGEVAETLREKRVGRLANRVVKMMEPGSESGANHIDIEMLQPLAEEIANSGWVDDALQRALTQGRQKAQTPAELKRQRELQAARDIADQGKAVDDEATVAAKEAREQAMEEANRAGTQQTPEGLKAVGDDAFNKTHAEHKARETAEQKRAGEKDVADYKWVDEDAADTAKQAPAHERLTDEFGVEPTGAHSIKVGKGEVTFEHQSDAFLNVHSGLSGNGFADDEVGRVLWSIYNDVEYMKGLRVAELQGLPLRARHDALRDEALQRLADLRGESVGTYQPRDPKDLRVLAENKMTTPPLQEHGPVRPPEPEPGAAEHAAPRGDRDGGARSHRRDCRCRWRRAAPSSSAAG